MLMGCTIFCCLLLKKIKVDIPACSVEKLTNFVSPSRNPLQKPYSGELYYENKRNKEYIKYKLIPKDRPVQLKGLEETSTIHRERNS